MAGACGCRGWVYRKMNCSRLCFSQPMGALEIGGERGESLRKSFCRVGSWTASHAGLPSSAIKLIRNHRAVATPSVRVQTPMFFVLERLRSSTKLDRGSIYLFSK